MLNYIGFACKAQGLKIKPKSIKKDTFYNQGLAKIQEIIEHNLVYLHKLIEYMIQCNIKFYRVSGDLLPWKSHYQLSQLLNFTVIKNHFDIIANLIKNNNIRITTHPGQFNVITTESQTAWENTLADLTVHMELLDLLGLPQTPYAKINIHLSGKSKNKLESFKKNFNTLPEGVKNRLTLENDDTPNGNKIEDLVPYVEYAKIPIVFDFYHNLLLPSSWDINKIYNYVLSTWNGIVPVMHYSESLQLETSNLKLSKKAHSYNCTGVLPKVPYLYDLMIEAKNKEMSIKQLKDWDGVLVTQKFNITLPETL